MVYNELSGDTNLASHLVNEIELQMQSSNVHTPRFTRMSIDSQGVLNVLTKILEQQHKFKNQKI